MLSTFDSETRPIRQTPSYGDCLGTHGHHHPRLAQRRQAGVPRSVIPRATEPGITGSRPSQRHMRRNAPDSDYLQMPPRAIGGDVATGRLARGRQKARRLKRTPVDSRRRVGADARHFTVDGAGETRHPVKGRAGEKWISSTRTTADHRLQPWQHRARQPP